MTSPSVLIVSTHAALIFAVQMIKLNLDEITLGLASVESGGLGETNTNAMSHFQACFDKRGVGLCTAE